MVELAQRPCQHWLVTVALRAHLKGAEQLDCSSETVIGEAWRRTAGACGVTDSGLARIVADDFDLPVADFDSVKQIAYPPTSREIALSGSVVLAIHLINADGTGDRRVTDDAGFFGPRWSPDGSKLVFALKTPPEPGCGRLQLWQVNSDGTDLESIPETREEGGGCGGGWEASWSPNGTDLILTFHAASSLGGKNAGCDFLQRLDLVTREQTTVADFDCWNGQPSWRSGS